MFELHRDLPNKSGGTGVSRTLSLRRERSNARMKLAAATLENDWVRLEPFEERHRAGLTEAAHADVSIFAHMPFGVAEKGYDAWFDWLRAEQAEGRWIPHAVVAPGGRIVGQTCYLAIRPEHSGVEIGGTWYTREAQATAINPAAKLLLLTHAFACGAERVEFKTDALNVQSRGALTKLGATFEGVFRRQMRRPNGTMRDNAYFSIVRDEWDEVRPKIEARLHAPR
jgi:RimJ/RimL family protein N-acetyltransferase